MAHAERDTRRLVLYGRYVAARQCRFGACTPCGSGFRLDNHRATRSTGPRGPFPCIGRGPISGSIYTFPRNRRQRLTGSIHAQGAHSPPPPRHDASISPGRHCPADDATAVARCGSFCKTVARDPSRHAHPYFPVPDKQPCRRLTLIDGACCRSRPQAPLCPSAAPPLPPPPHRS